MAWKQREGEYPFWDGLPEELIPIFDPDEGSPPLSYVMVQKSGEYPYLIGQSLIPMSAPYPVSVMVQKAGSYPKLSGLNLMDIGAFSNAENLKYVRIPPATTSIGDHAFTHTKLIRVRISENCTYGDKTFPSGCEIKYY